MSNHLNKIRSKSNSDFLRDHSLQMTNIFPSGLLISIPVVVSHRFELMGDCACMLSCFSCVRLFVTPWTIARQAPLSMGLSRQEYCSGLPCPPPGDLPDPGMEPVPLMSPALAGRFFTTSATWEAPMV